MAKQNLEYTIRTTGDDDETVEHGPFRSRAAAEAEYEELLAELEEENGVYQILLLRRDLDEDGGDGTRYEVLAGAFIEPEDGEDDDGEEDDDDDD